MFGWYIADAMALSDALSRMTGDFFLKNLVANQSTAGIDDVLGNVISHDTVERIDGLAGFRCRDPDPYKQASPRLDFRREFQRICFR